MGLKEILKYLEKETKGKLDSQGNQIALSIKQISEGFKTVGLNKQSINTSLRMKQTQRDLYCLKFKILEIETYSTQEDNTKPVEVKKIRTRVFWME